MIYNTHTATLETEMTPGVNQGELVMIFMAIMAEIGTIWWLREPPPHNWLGRQMMWGVAVAIPAIAVWAEWYIHH